MQGKHVEPLPADDLKRVSKTDAPQPEFATRGLYDTSLANLDLLSPSAAKQRRSRSSSSSGGKTKNKSYIRRIGKRRPGALTNSLQRNVASLRASQYGLSVPSPQHTRPKTAPAHRIAASSDDADFHDDVDDDDDDDVDGWVVEDEPRHPVDGWTREPGSDAVHRPATLFTTPLHEVSPFESPPVVTLAFSPYQ
jgi:hypothetical protein